MATLAWPCPIFAADQHAHASVGMAPGTRPKPKNGINSVLLSRSPPGNPCGNRREALPQTVTPCFPMVVRRPNYLTAAACRVDFLLSFAWSTESQNRGIAMKPRSKKKAVIAYRKTCQAKGTGLSHYILMDRKAK